MEQVKTVWGSATLAQGLCDGDLLVVMQQTLEFFQCQEFSQLLGLDKMDAGAHAVAESAKVCLSMFNLVVNFLGELALTCLSYLYEPPSMYLRLLSRKPGDCQVALVYLRGLYEAWQKLRALHLRECDAFLQDLKWTTQHFSLEVMLSLAAHEWQLPQHISDILQRSRESWHSTCVVENGFRLCRRKEVSATDKSGILAAWHGLVTSSDYLEEYGRPHLVAEPSAETTSSVSDDVCQLSGESAMPPQDLDLTLQSSPGFPTLSINVAREAVLRSMSMMQTRGDWQLLQRAWLAHLVHPGWLLCHTTFQGGGWLALRPTNFGLLALRCCLKRVSGVVIVDELFSKPEDVDYIRPDNVLEWKVLTLTCVPPSSPDWPAGAGRLGMCLISQQGTKSRPLLDVALHHGFRNLTLHELRRLTDEVCVAGGTGVSSNSSSSASAMHPASTASTTDSFSVRDCVEALAKKRMKSPSRDDVDAILARRKTRPGDDVINETVVEDASALLCDSDSSVDAAEADEVEQVTMDLVTARTRRTLQKPAETERALAKARARAPHLLLDLAAVPFKDDAPLSFKEARDYFPPGAIPELELVRFQRWKCSAPYMGKHVSRVFGRRSGFSQDDSLRYVLAAAWKAYTASSGEQSPFKLDFAL